MTFDEIKQMANFISKKMDIPVSVQADGESLSLAFFWDTRVLGSMKMLDYQTFTSCKALDLDQYAELQLETSFDAETLLMQNQESETEPAKTFPHFLLDGFVVSVKT